MKKKSMEQQEAPIRVGILGGGQLSRLLIASARELGSFADPVVLTSHRSDPAAQIARRSVLGNLTDEAALEEFASQANTVIFENEFVDCNQLSRFSAVRFLPSLSVIAKLQDKLTQKEILARLKIPSARFFAFSPDFQGLRDWIHEAFERFRGEVVFKWAKYGYDGKGTFLVSPGANPSSLDQVKEFCEAALARGSRVFAEERLRFRRELAMVGCFSTRGEFTAYPLVISEQENGICKWVKGPATSLGVETRLETEARKYLEVLARDVSLVGTFAVEFFETDQGEIQVNEMAPRVHNTGHYTLDAAATSQFENHWRAVLGMPLGSVETRRFFAMLNLLGPSRVSARISRESLSSSLSSHFAPAVVHWYGKLEIRQGRKLGHVNGIADSQVGLESLLRKLEERDRDWGKLL